MAKLSLFIHIQKQRLNADSASGNLCFKFFIVRVLDMSKLTFVLLFCFYILYRWHYYRPEKWIQKRF